MWDTLEDHRAVGYLVRPEDVERLSPLSYQHINVHGTYYFTLPESVAQGHRRSLHPLAAAPEDLC